jgi:hypothetical protein
LIRRQLSGRASGVCAISLALSIGLGAHQAVGQQADTERDWLDLKALCDGGTAEMAFCIEALADKADRWLANIVRSYLRAKLRSDRELGPPGTCSAMFNPVEIHRNAYEAFLTYRATMTDLTHVTWAQGSIVRVAVPSTKFNLTVEHATKLLELCRADGTVPDRIDLTREDWCE